MTPNTDAPDDAAEGTTFDHALSRIAVGAYDDAQSMRTSSMNRIRDIIRKRNEGIPLDEPEDEKDDDDYETKYADEHLPDLIGEMVADDVLTEREYQYISDMLDAARAAQRIENSYQNVMRVTEAEPIWTDWLEDVRGVSTVLTARLLHKFGYCEEFDRVSEIWAYAGLAPGQKLTRGEQAGFDPDAKTLAWMIADSFVKQGDQSPYRVEFYDPYKLKQMRRMDRAEDMTDAQLEAEKWTPPQSRAHADNRARRYMAKKFLKHYWYIARTMKGHDTPDEWVITHGGHEKRTDTFENPAYAWAEVTG